MTSKISFSKLQREDMKHRLSVVLVSVFLFLAKDLLYFILLQNASEATYNLDTERIREVLSVVSNFTKTTSADFLYLLPLAVLLGVNAFRYLHNRSRVDFMHSLPVTRGCLYTVFLVNDLLIYIVPYLLGLAIQTVITMGFGVITKEYFGWMISGIFHNLIIFLIIYLQMVLCMLLTGQTFVALLAFAVFSTYGGIIIHFVCNLLPKVFHDTFVQISLYLANVLEYLTPVILGVDLVTDNYYTAIESSGNVLIGCLVWIVILLVFTFFLFQKRPSESAGQAMAFKRGQKLIKVMITVPMAIYTGIFLYSLTMENYVIWLYIGVVLGGFLFHGLVECIYRSDVKGLWSNKKDLIFIVLLTALIILGAEADILGISTNVPAADKVTSVEVEGLITDTTLQYGTVDKEPEKYVGLDGAAKDRIVEMVNDVKDQKESDLEESYTARIYYHMANGNIIYREYVMSEEQWCKFLEVTYEELAYKKHIYPILRMDLSTVTSILAEHPIDSKDLNLSKESKEEFLKTFVEELSATTYSEIVNEKPVARLILYSETEIDGQIEGARIAHDIYPSYKKTIELLNKYGATTAANAKDLQLSRLNVSYYDKDENYHQFVISDIDVINSVKEKLYFSDLESTLFANGKTTQSLEGIAFNQTYSFSTDQDTFEKLQKYQ